MMRPNSKPRRLPIGMVRQQHGTMSIRQNSWNAVAHMFDGAEHDTETGKRADRHRECGSGHKTAAAQ